MTSKELNEKIVAIENREDLDFEAFGGKIIPYIGWFWRDVNFDSEDYYFGILPIYDNNSFDSNDKERLGFMESNKWDYDYKYCPPEIWKEIKFLLEIAVNNSCVENLKAVNDKIQSLLLNEGE